MGASDPFDAARDMISIMMLFLQSHNFTSLVLFLKMNLM